MGGVYLFSLPLSLDIYNDSLIVAMLLYVLPLSVNIINPAK